MMSDAAFTSTLRQILAVTDLFLPSGEEILLFANASDEQEAAKRLISQGVKEIALKRGAAGAQVVTSAGVVTGAAFSVVELDPTGAGDCFGATYTVCRNNGMSIEQSLAYANAAGGRAVTVKGPMEGASTFADLDAFMAKQRLSHDRHYLKVHGTPPGRRVGGDSIDLFLASDGDRSHAAALQAGRRAGSDRGHV